MPQWQGRSRGTQLGYRIFVFVVKTFGVLPAYLLLRFVAFYYFLFSWNSSRHIYNYFRLRHRFSPIRSLFNLYANYFVFGQTILDKIVVMAGIENRYTYDFDGESHLHEIVRGGKGGILLSAHVGNWEAAGHLLKRLNARINVVMYDGEHEKIKQYMQEVTGGRNFNVIVIREDLSHVYAIGEALQKNELICLHADRFIDGSKTTEVNFLGAPARFPVGPFLLAATFDVPVSVVFAMKAGNLHYHFYGSPLIRRTADENKRDFTQRLLNYFVRDFEEKVREYPKQWFNYYNFWN
jgi:predicted LPLAT superfamily acyltransferase